MSFGEEFENPCPRDFQKGWGFLVGLFLIGFFFCLFFWGGFDGERLNIFFSFSLYCLKLKSTISPETHIWDKYNIAVKKILGNVRRNQR